MRLEDRKITELRKAHNLSLAALAQALYVNPTTVFNVEKGDTQYSDESMELAKKFFKIEGMPLSKFECDTFKRRLYLMLDNTRDGKLNEARVLCDNMARIVDLELCDGELPLLYRLFEVVVLIHENNMAAAKEKLNYLQERFEDMNTEHIYHFYCNMGAWNRLYIRYEEGLEFFKKALEISESNKDIFWFDSERLHINIAICYSHLEFPFRVIFYLQKIRGIYAGRRADTLDLTADLVLATNYISVNNLKEAENLLYNCRVRATSVNNNMYIGMTMHRFGLLHMKTKNWVVALEYLDQALSCFEEGTHHYLANLYQKIRCLAGDKKFVKANTLLMEAKSLYGDDEIYSAGFEALGHYIEICSRITIYNERSSKYIETVAIPYFIETHDHFIAIDYYELLELYYRDKNKKKSLMMTEAIFRIFERCFLYHQ